MRAARRAVPVAVLDLDDGTSVPVPEGVSADPATRGRITVRIPVPGIPQDRRIAGVSVTGTGARFRRGFQPYLTVPPGGVLSISLGLEDALMEELEP